MACLGMNSTDSMTILHCTLYNQTQVDLKPASQPEQAPQPVSTNSHYSPKIGALRIPG